MDGCLVKQPSMFQMDGWMFGETTKHVSNGWMDVWWNNQACFKWMDGCLVKQPSMFQMDGWMFGETTKHVSNGWMFGETTKHVSNGWMFGETTKHGSNGWMFGETTKHVSNGWMDVWWNNQACFKWMDGNGSMVISNQAFFYVKIWWKASTWNKHSSMEICQVPGANSGNFFGWFTTIGRIRAPKVI